MSAPVAQLLQQPAIAANLRYDPKKAGALTNNGQFFKVGGANKTVTKRSISGAVKSWDTENPRDTDIIFLRDFRIAGTPNDIRAALRAINADSATVENSIRNAISYQNRQQRAAEIQAELQNYTAAKSTKTQTESYPPATIIWMFQNLDKAKIATKAATNQVAGATQAQGARSPRASNIRAAYEKAAASGGVRMLDVSKVTAAGTGYKSTTPKQLGAQYARYGNIPIYSNNVEGYRNAINAIFGQGQQQEAIAEISRMLQPQAANIAPAPGTYMAPAPAPMAAQMPPASRVPVPGTYMMNAIPMPSAAPLPNAAPLTSVRTPTPGTGVQVTGGANYATIAPLSAIPRQ